MKIKSHNNLQFNKIPKIVQQMMTQMPHDPMVSTKSLGAQNLYAAMGPHDGEFAADFPLLNSNPQNQLQTNTMFGGSMTFPVPVLPFNIGHLQGNVRVQDAQPLISSLPPKVPEESKQQHGASGDPSDRKPSMSDSCQILSMSNPRGALCRCHGTCTHAAPLPLPQTRGCEDILKCQVC